MLLGRGTPLLSQPSRSMACNFSGWASPQSALERSELGNRGRGERRTRRESTEYGAAPAKGGGGTDVGLSTYPSREGGGPVGHGRLNHLKTKHKKHSRTQRLKKRRWLKIN